jgi:hypothetical protein
MPSGEIIGPAQRVAGAPWAVVRVVSCRAAIDEVIQNSG